MDSLFAHLAWTNMPLTVGGLGPVNIPLLSDLTHNIGKAFNVYLDRKGVSLLSFFIIGKENVLR